MLEKPELYVSADRYGMRTQSEYEWVVEKMECEADFEALHNLIMCVYKDGVKDGIELCRRLDTE